MRNNSMRPAATEMMAMNVTSFFGVAEPVGDGVDVPVDCAEEDEVVSSGM
jgi:hypothetical protein